MTTLFSRDEHQHHVMVSAEFAAPRSLVFAAFTRSEELDKWWAPKPWRCETVSRDFVVGGSWLYCMCGPAGEKAYGKADYTAITPGEYFAGLDSFCDENGQPVGDIAPTEWHVSFRDSDVGTTVTVLMKFATPADMQKTLDMGFEQGFSMALENLRELLAA